MSFFAETEFDHNLVEMLMSTVAPGQFAARNAIRHLDKAESLAVIDPEMAAFRAITAEEESATAVFRSIQRHRYPGHEALRIRDHRHKSALNPFSIAVSELLGIAHEKFNLAPRLRIDGAGNSRRLVTEFHVGGLGFGDRYASPQPPLNMEIRQGTALHDFAQQLANIATGQKCASIIAHVERRANMRNRILYASATGLPGVTLNRFLQEQRRAVKVNIALFLLIDPYDDHQLLVCQTLRAFLKMLEVLPAALSDGLGAE